MELSQKLKELRKKQGLTQLELAERLFVSRQAIPNQASERSGGQGNRRNAGSIGAGPEGCSISTAPK